MRYYGQWMRNEAEKRIGHLYPKAGAWFEPRTRRYFGEDEVRVWKEIESGKVENSEAAAGLETTARACGYDTISYFLHSISYTQLTVIAWLWARTVKSPNPAFADVEVPLASTFILSSKPGKEAYVEPIILGGRAEPGSAGVSPAFGGGLEARPPRNGTAALPGYRFTVKVGKPPESAKDGTSAGKRAAFKCLMSGTPIPYDYIRAEGQSGRMGARLMAIVAEGPHGRVYLPPTEEHEAIARSAQPTWKPEVALPVNPRDFKTPLYGLMTFSDLFTPRQLVALTTFSDLVAEAIEKCRRDYLGAQASSLHAGGTPALPGAGGTPALPETPSWHSRGYLPHWEAGEISQSITFRLHDSLPRDLLEQWQHELSHLPESEHDQQRRKRIEAALDAGYGACWLRRPEIASLVQDALRHFDGQRYRLLAWVIMPNHVHVLVTPLRGYSLSSILHTWKSFTAKEANQLLGRSGEFWQKEYFDRAIRDEEHFVRAVAYIENNPVQAGLCARAEDWEFSSARVRADTPPWERRLPACMRAGRPRSQDDIPLDEGGSGALAYAQAVGVYLSFLVNQVANHSSSVCGWNSVNAQMRSVFARQAIPMVWDYAESNPFCDSSGSYDNLIERQVKGFAALGDATPGEAFQENANIQTTSAGKIVSTDPPYYDNIGYADLSDFFYVWLRRTLRPIFPSLYATLAVPKSEELVATPYRHGGREAAEKFFLEGMTKALENLARQAHPAFPVTIYYAFKQQETLGGRAEPGGAGETPALPGTASTGWETFLEAVIRAGFAITGTWPMRTEGAGRIIAKDTNALASSIVLVCRRRPTDAPTATRREFVSALKAELPPALRLLQGLGLRASGPDAGGTPALPGIAPGIAPVDLAQAAIGPGMAVFTRYAKVLDAEGRPVSVREALALINATLDEVLAEQEGDFDADTRFAIAWFEQYGFDEGEFGVAETLSKAKNTSVTGLAEAGILKSGRGKVRLVQPKDLPADWDPATDARLTDWEIVHHLIRVLESGGERGAAELVAKLGPKAGIARELAYRLYTVCERRKRAAEARAYNALVQSWTEIVRLAHEGSTRQTGQASLFEGGPR